MNEATIIRINGLTKHYGSKCAVDNLNLKVKEGEIFGMIGPNGAGKSTTIECLLGAKKADSGNLEILGYDPCNTKTGKQLYAKIGVQFQSSFYPELIRVEEICQLMSSLYEDTVDYRILLDQFGLKDKGKQAVKSLSGGERQKLSVLISLLNKPKVLFLDELTTGLDPQARRDVWHLLEALKKKGMTIFLTSHFMDEVEYLCDHVLILKEGKAVVTGTVNEIKDKYNTANLEETYLQIVGEEKKNYEIIENTF